MIRLINYDNVIITFRSLFTNEELEAWMEYYKLYSSKVWLKLLDEKLRRNEI